MTKKGMSEAERRKFYAEPNVSDVPHLMDEWHSRGDWRAALSARVALTNGCDDLLSAADRESRGLTGAENRQFDEHARTARQITEELQAYRREVIADLVARGIDASECRLPF
jgi:hypothetical protein